MRYPAILWLASVTVAVAAAAGSSATGPAGDASRVPWRELTYRARKLIFTATTVVRVQDVPVASAANLLRTAPQGISLPPLSPTLAVVTLDSDLPFGRREAASTCIDPLTGQALGSEKRNFGHDLVWKARRYAAGGVYTWRAEPRDGDVEDGPPEGWHNREEGYHPYLETLPPGAVVTDSYALLYLLTKARLDRPGSRLTLYLLSRDHVVEATFTAGGTTREDVDLDEVRGGSTTHREGSVAARTVTGTARALSETGEGAELELLGLKGDLSLSVEIGTGIPLLISGRAGGIGRVRVRLRRVVAAAPDETGVTPRNGRR